jgi:Fe-S-cluster containining protein
MRTDEVPNCQSCGACCLSGAARYIRVTGNDYDRLGERAEDLVHFIGNQAFMRMAAYRCVALEFDANCSKFACSVYAQRPAACRELESGSSACRGERTIKAELVQLTLREHGRVAP